MKIVDSAIIDVKVLTPTRLGDDRGYFCELFRIDYFEKYCGNYSFIQDNESLSAKVGTIRGLHFQTPPYAQGKLVRCTAGALFDVAVDIRHGSPTYGQWVAEELTPSNGKQLWIPPGFAHGFCTLLPDTVICYKVTDYYAAECDKGLTWDDPDLAIQWPDVASAETLSPKDCRQPKLAEIAPFFTWRQ